MSENDENHEQNIHADVLTLLTMLRHRSVIQDSLRGIAQQLERRGELHDLSKFRPDEFEGFRDAGFAARNYKFGSPEYEEGLKALKAPDGAFTKHAKRNRHHPEHFAPVGDMSFIDIIEMVCDWHAAAATYGNNTLREGLEKQRERFPLNDHYWWLIEEVVRWLENEHGP